MTLYVRGAAISVQTWCRIGPPTPRRAHPDYPRIHSACTTEGNPAFSFGFFCQITLVSCAYHNDQSHLVFELTATTGPILQRPEGIRRKEIEVQITATKTTGVKVGNAIALGIRPSFIGQL
jgi:hypothetical protein